MNSPKQKRRKLHDFEDDNDKYEQYMKMIDNLEPYSNMLKEEIRQ